MAKHSSAITAVPERTLKSHVIEQIRNAILTGEFAPGERLNETHLAGRFKVSRIPVREALGQLQEQGLVMSRPRRGMFVISLSEEDVQRINSLRIVLEAEAIKLCRANMTPSVESRLTTLLNAMEDRKTLSDLDASSLDLEFHRNIWACSGNPYLEKTLNSLVTVLFAHQALAYLKDGSEPRWPLHHHRALLDVVLGNSDTPAEVAMVNHLRIRYTNPERFCSFAIHRSVAPPQRVGKRSRASR